MSIKKIDRVSEKIRSLRFKNKLSQVKFAESLGYSQGYLNDIEKGRSEPSKKFLEALRRVYGVPIDWLLAKNPIVDIINRNSQVNDPELIFAYAFSQHRIDASEDYLKSLLKHEKTVFVNASRLNNSKQLLSQISGIKGDEEKMWTYLEHELRCTEMILVIKNVSLSGIPNSGRFIKNIFDILLNKEWLRSNNSLSYRHFEFPPSSLIILDFPSYLENNQETFGHYAVPVHMVWDV